jgi:PhnB protein
MPMRTDGPLRIMSKSGDAIIPQSPAAYVGQKPVYNRTKSSQLRIGEIMPSKLNPYISFRDTAREAMEFYKNALGGELTLSTYAEGGMPHNMDEADKLMHGMLVAENGMTLMGADTPNSMKHTEGSNISISLSGDDEAELRGYWDKLAEGGTVIEPLAKAPWGDTFGMFTDKFGVHWMVNIAGPKA